MRRKGQPPTASTATASPKTSQPLASFSGANSATNSAASAKGQEAMARQRQPSGSACSSASSGCPATGAAEYPPADTASQSSFSEAAEGSKVT